MISVFLREQKRYTQEDLVKEFRCSEEKTVRILKRLKEYGVLKAVKANDTQKDLTDLVDEDIEIADVEVGENEYLYVFTFVGVITIEGRVLKCYPKYLLDATAPKAELKQVLKVLEKYNSKEQIIRMYNDTSDSSAFNMLAVMLFLLQDYFEYGAYTNTQDIIESNGSGDILWDKTINETFTLLSNNRPYYPELLTMKRVNDDFDFFKRLHECVLTHCTEELRDADLLDLFDIMGVDISDEHIEDFGGKEYVLERIVKELNVQFNTRKQLLLKTLYAYIANSSALDDLDCFGMFGTNSFNLVWEKVCAEVMDNQLQKPIGGLRLPMPLAEQYRDIRHKKLIDLIDKPQWSGTAPNSELFIKQAEDTLIPDLISIVNVDGNYQFIIFDDFDFFKRLHECVLTHCTEELRDADLLDLFDIMGVDISDEHIEDFGGKEYVLERIVKELNVQFNTRKQLLLKTLYAYIANSSALDDLDCFGMFGTNSFNLVWEKVCAEVMDNQLQKPIGGLRLPMPLAEQYRDIRHKKLIDLIDKPQWSGTAPNSELFIKQAEDTLIPDLISIVNVDGNYQFIIFDAKYYNIQLEHNKKLRGQPGIESITKQYLYQLAYQPFVEAHQIGTVRNCFLMPTSSAEIVEKGTVSLDMLSKLGLQDIQIRLLPAQTMYRHYIENTKMDIRTLNL